MISPHSRGGLQHFQHKVLDGRMLPEAGVRQRTPITSLQSIHSLYESLHSTGKQLEGSLSTSCIVSMCSFRGQSNAYSVNAKERYSSITSSRALLFPSICRPTSSGSLEVIYLTPSALNAAEQHCCCLQQRLMRLRSPCRISY